MATKQEIDKQKFGRPGSSNANWRHGHTVSRQHSRTYDSWANMIARCTQVNHHKYPRYGGRGIQICQRWRDSFSNFLSDMGERPNGKTLDRFPNNDGNYEPGNCRWATPKEQSANKDSGLIDLQGQRFGRLVAVKSMGCGESGGALWFCQCDCGESKVILGSSLRTGRTRSCGCLRREYLGH